MSSRLLQKIGKNAQQTIPGLIFLFALFVTLSALTPGIITLTQTTAGNLSAGGQPMAAMVVNLIPLFLWLIFIITCFIYVQPFRQG